jgi:hypothetical protein
MTATVHPESPRPHPGGAPLVRRIASTVLAVGLLSTSLAQSPVRRPRTRASAC